MNRSEITNQVQRDIIRKSNSKLLTGQFRTATKTLGGVELNTDDILNSLDSEEDSFLNRSKIAPLILQQSKTDTLTLAELASMTMYAKAIEDGDSKAFATIRDTSGEQLINQVKFDQGGQHNLTDDELDYLLASAEVIEDES